MPAFLKVRRNQLIIGGVLILLVVLLGLFIFLPRSQPTSPTSSAGTATVTPSPSPDLSPSPSPSPNASASPVASPTGVAPIPPAPPGIGPAGALLRNGQAFDDTPTLFGGSGGGCGIWHHPAWSQDDCGIVVIGGDTEHSMAWVTEHKTAAPTARRVSILKGTTGPWVTALYLFDNEGGSFTNITVKAGDFTGDGIPKLVVGMRAVGTNHVLNLDGVRRNGLSDPLVIIHRELVNGRATLSGGLTDYSAAGSGYTRTVITYSGSSFHGTSTTVGTAPAGDFPP